MTNATTEYDEIVRVIQLYIDGASKGDVAKLGEAFHADSRMFGEAGGTRYDMPIVEFFDLASQMPGDTGNSQGRVTSVIRRVTPRSR